ncbi:hypothetical protein AB3S75_011754 [Citrus x aurantiifolia]
MAVALSNHSLLASPRLSSSASLYRHRKTLALHSFNRRPPLLNLGLPLHNNTGPGFKSFFAINNKEGFHDGEQASGSEADQKHLLNLKTLIEAYKEAVSNGDEKAVSDIEARIFVVQNEKNELLRKVSSLSAEITSGKEKCIRLQADFENSRKRSEKERLAVRSDAQGKVIERLLLLVDSFERARLQIKPETEKEKKIDTSYQGIYKQFVEIMRSMQVAAVPTVGKPFDPAVHEAIAREESEEFNEGIIIEETRRGFLLGDRLIRPARVKVSVGPGRKKASVATEKSAGQPATAAEEGSPLHE